jgi:hypothetical protein
MPRVVVQLTPQAAEALRAGSKGSPDLDAVIGAVSEHRAILTPLDPVPVHPVIAPFFFIDLLTPEDAQSLIARLQGNSTVIAAYAEPQVGRPLGRPSE